MMKRSRFKGTLGVAFFCMGIGYFGLETCAQAPYPGIEMVEPKQIQVGSFFSGEIVNVRAIFPGDCDLALRLSGPRENLNLRRKGRVGGLWMNVEEIAFAEVPKVYLLWTSRKAAPGGEKSLKELQLDYGSVLAGSLQGKESEEKQFLIQELIRLKEQDRLYHISEGTIRIQPLGPSLCQAEAVLHLPAKIPPGSYTLELMALRGASRNLLRSRTLNVQLTGFPAALSGLARQNGLLYGLLAVGIAVFCGLVMGVFFSSRAGH